MSQQQSDLPSHASPMIAPQALPRASSQILQGLSWNDLDRSSQPSTPGIPDNLISPAFTPPLTPGTPSSQFFHEPKSIPVDTSLDDPETTKQPRLLERLPVVECVVRARIPTTSGAEMFLHLYQNDVDNKEHLAIVFGNNIRSRSLDAEKPGETEMDRMIRGAYMGRLRPGRISSREDTLRIKKGIDGRRRSGSALKNVTIPEECPSEEVVDPSPTQTREQNEQATSTSNPSVSAQNERSSEHSQPPHSTHLSSISTTVPPLPTSDTSITSSKPPLVRIHSECYTGETAWSARCDCGEQLDEAARLMSLPSSSSSTNPAGGVIVYLRQEGRGIGLASKLKAYNLQDLGSDTVEANLLLRHPADARSYGLATAILVDLGLGTDIDTQKAESERGIRLLTNNPDKVRAVEGPGREVRVVERVAMVPLAWKSGGLVGVKGREIEKYLETKIGRMGHMLER